MRHFGIKFSCHSSHTFVSEMLEREIYKVEIYSFQKGAGMRGDKAFATCLEPTAPERLIRRSFI
jgi:hypothetical protein